MSEEYTVVATLLAEAEQKKADLLNRQQDFNMATVNNRKSRIQKRIDKFVALQSTAGPKAAEALQKHIDHVQSSYDYWDGPEPANERAKLGPQISEVSQLVAQLSILLSTLGPPP